MGLVLHSSEVQQWCTFTGTPHTSQSLQVYGSVWHTAPETRTALEKLYNTWHRFFPSDVLARAESQRQPVQVAQPSVQYQAAHSFQQLSPGHASAAYPLQQRNSPQRYARAICCCRH